MKFSLYFVGFEKAEDIPADEEERTRWMLSQKATVELTQYVQASLLYVPICACPLPMNAASA